MNSRTLNYFAVPALLPLFLTGCPYSKGPRLQLPETPTALTEINSEYDDFNSAAPDTAGGTLVFSSNRGSKGTHFDLFQTTLGFRDKEVKSSVPIPFAEAAMSPVDELGPFIRNDVLVFASDRAGGAGGLDLYRAPANGKTSATPIEGINTRAYEGYWTSHSTDDWAIFASDRDGDLDAYRIEPALGGPNAKVTRIDALSVKGANDTAFYIERDYVLFASARNLTKGNYDLFCASIRPDGSFGKVVHLDGASSSHKDFRPIAIRGHRQDILVFSSDRPGGKGGMDLYYAAFDRCRGSN